MFSETAKRLAPALLAVATLTLFNMTCLRPALAQTATAAQPDDVDTVLAAREYLKAIDYRSITEAKIATVARTKTALKIMLEREPLLENQEAKIIAARFTAEELRESSKFQRTVTGSLFRNFNRDMSSPFVTTEIYHSEIAKRFTAQQRAEVFNYLNSAVGQKWRKLMPELTKAEQEIGEEWGQQTQKAIDEAVRTGQELS
jgi:hypothetical protein